MATKSASFIDFFAKDYRRAIVIGVMLVVIIVLLVVFWGRIKDIFKQIQAKLSNKTLQNEWTAQTGELPQLTRAQLAVYVSQLKQAGRSLQKTVRPLPRDTPFGSGRFWCFQPPHGRRAETVQEF